MLMIFQSLDDIVWLGLDVNMKDKEAKSRKYARFMF